MQVLNHDAQLCIAAGDSVSNVINETLVAEVREQGVAAISCSLPGFQIAAQHICAHAGKSQGMTWAMAAVSDLSEIMHA